MGMEASGGIDKRTKEKLVEDCQEVGEVGGVSAGTSIFIYLFVRLLPAPSWSMPGARSGPGTRPTSGRETRWTTFTTYLAFRNTRMKEEAMALKYVRALLQVDPRNRQAQVRLLIEN